jgi:hypothetical protein
VVVVVLLLLLLLRLCELGYFDVDLAHAAGGEDVRRTLADAPI